MFLSSRTSTSAFGLPESSKLPRTGHAAWPRGARRLENLMLKVLLSRVGQAILVMLVVSAVSFVMFRFVGDPVATMSRESATTEEKAELRRSLGLDQSVIV